jgi:pimeloyl-ACP methyl ester carboxylesterase
VKSTDLTFERGGLTFRATMAGPTKGDTAVLLHGFPGSRATWDRVSVLLHRSGVRTVALQQRGYGPTSRPIEVSAYRLPELGADVLGLLDELDIDRCHLVGHDWGGNVSWYLAATAPHRLQSLTVLSTPHPRALGRSMGRSLQGLRSLYALAFQVPALPEVLLSAGGGQLLKSSLQMSGLDRRVAARYSADLANPDAMRAALNWYRAAFRYPADAAAVGAIGVPTTYVWSRGDLALGGVAARLTGEYVSADYRFETLEASHWIPETCPSQTAALILDRIRRA